MKKSRTQSRKVGAGMHRSGNSAVSRVLSLLASKSWWLTSLLRKAVHFAKMGTSSIRSTHLFGRLILIFSLIKKAILYSRKFGWRSAFQRAIIVIQSNVMPGEKTTQVAPLSVSRIIWSPESCQQDVQHLRIGMLVANLHDGGLEMWCVRVTQEFQRLGIDCQILCFGNTVSTTMLAEAKNCRIKVFNGNLAYFVSAILDSGIEILLTSHCYDGLEPLARKGIRIIEIIHNTYFWQHGNLTLSALRHTSINQFIAVSSFVHDYCVAALSIKDKHITLVENGLSHYGLIRPPLQTLLQRRKATIDHPLLIHVANAHPQKNHIAVLQAFAKVLKIFPTAMLVLAGDINVITNLSHRIQAEIKDRDLQDRVLCPGILNRREISRLLTDAHVGLLPSTFEGFSLATLEYSYFALPVVLSATGGSQFLAKRYGHVVIAEAVAFSPRELDPVVVESQALNPRLDVVNSIAEAITTVLLNYDEIADRAQRAAADWQTYSMENMVQRILNVIRGTGS